MIYGMADYLLYCFQTEVGDLDCWLIDFPNLQSWFWTNIEQFSIIQMPDGNKTKGRVVPSCSPA